MSSWFNLDPNKIKQLAASTLINAQKQIDKVLDIKEGTPSSEQPPSTSSIYNNMDTNVTSNNAQPPPTDDFFSTFLVEKNPPPVVVVATPKESQKENLTSNWNSWTNSFQDIPEKESDVAVIEQHVQPKEEEEEDKTVIMNHVQESIEVQQPQSSSSFLAESSTITESSSSDSGGSLRPTLSIRISESSESTVIGGGGMKTTPQEKTTSMTTTNDTTDHDDEHRPVSLTSLTSDKRDVIDLWMNNRDNSSIVDAIEQSQHNDLSSSSINDENTSSLLYTSAYPPNVFHTSSMIDEELTPTPTVASFNEQHIAAIATDEEDGNTVLEQPSSPTHTTSSSNGHDTNGKDSSDDGKHTSCASSDIEVISSPSVSGGIATSTTAGFDKCRELRDARRPAVREVVVRFPSHSGNLKYSRHPLSMVNADETITSNLDAPSWSTLIDEAATEPNSAHHYQNSNDGDDDDDHLQQQKLHMSATVKELGELKERLELREQTNAKLTKESNELHHTNQALKQSLSEFEMRTSRLTSEFQQTIENLTMKLDEQRHLAQDRDHLRKQLDTLQKQLFESSTSSGNAMAILRDKEEQIQQLLDEGEKLSKTQLQHTNIIKKLRNKEKDNESQLATLNTRVEKLTSELDEAKKSLEEKDENDKQLRDTVKKLERTALHYEKECISLKSLLEDAEEQVRSTKVALENSYKEIAELNKTKAASESKVVEATLSAEILLREEIRMALDKERLTSRQEQEKLQMTIDELRHSIQRSEVQLSRREQMLRQEINDLRQRLQEAESRNEELTQNISSATRPLLRQIENLQTTYITQINSLEKTERQLTDRLSEMQAQYAMSIEHERIANETLLETNAKWKLAEAQLATLKQDKTRLMAELEIIKVKLTNAEDTKLRERAQIESMQEAFTQQINTLIQEKRQLEIDADFDKTKYESDLKKMQIIHDSLKEQQDLSDKRSLSRNDSNLESTLASTGQRSTGGRDTPLSLFAFERLPFVPTPKPSVYEALRNTGAIAVLENLEAQLKEKEGEISLLQSEISDLERTRESMARELVNLSNQNELLQEQTREYPLLDGRYKELQKRYDALLTMYGEKQEEAEELKLDLVDVKNLYRAQIDDLMKQASQTR